MNANPLPGEVWLVDFGYDGKHRPALVVSKLDANCRLAIASVVQITTQFAGNSLRNHSAARALAARAKLLQRPNDAAGCLGGVSEEGRTI